MAHRDGYAASTELSLTTSWQGALVEEQDDAPSSGDVPERGTLTRIEVDLTDLNGVSSVTFFLSHDADGEQAITPHGSDGATQDVSLAPDSLVVGSVVWLLERLTWVSLGSGPYVWLQTDAGTATATARLYWEHDH